MNAYGQSEQGMAFLGLNNLTLGCLCPNVTAKVIAFEGTFPPINEPA